MKTKRIDIDFSALSAVHTFTPVTAVPSRQKYDSKAQTYSPDYSLVPLTLQLNVRLIDPDSVLDGNGNLNLVNGSVKFYKDVNGVREQILSTTEGYEMVTSGVNAGRLVVKKNIEPSKVTTFIVEYAIHDSRLGQVIHLSDSFRTYCDSVASDEAVRLDHKSALYDPLIYNDNSKNQPQTVDINADFFYGGVTVEPDASKLKFVWQKQRADETWSAIGSDILDYEASVSGVSNRTLTVNRDLMGDYAAYRCYGFYDITGNINETISNATPMAVISFKRRVPEVDVDIQVPSFFSPSVKTFTPTYWLSQKQNGGISNEDNIFHKIWMGAQNTETANVSYQQLGHGISPILSTSLLNGTKGMILGLDLVDCGAPKAMSDEESAVYIDSDGSILLM